MYVLFRLKVVIINKNSSRNYSHISLLWLLKFYFFCEKFVSEFLLEMPWDLVNMKCYVAPIEIKKIVDPQICMTYSGTSTIHSHCLSCDNLNEQHLWWFENKSVKYAILTCWLRGCYWKFKKCENILCLRDNTKLRSHNMCEIPKMFISGEAILKKIDSFECRI